MEDVPAPTPLVRKHAALIAGMSLFASWVMFFKFWPLAGGSVLAIGIVLGFHSRKASLTQLLVSPFVVMPLFSLALGVLGYVTGQGSFRTHGEPWIEEGNLDPKYRCPRSTSGCVVNGTEPFQETPNNVAIAVLTTLFGPMRGAYAGPYPTREEAIRAVTASNLRFLPGDLPGYAALLGISSGEPVEALERQMGWTLDKDVPIGAIIYQGETLILGREKCVFLVERRTGKIYARYVFHYSAWMLLANGQADQAIAGLNHAVEVDPRNPEYLHERGDAYLQKGDAGRARADYRKALEVAPADWHARNVVEGKVSRAGSVFQ